MVKLTKDNLKMMIDKMEKADIDAIAVDVEIAEWGEDVETIVFENWKDGYYVETLLELDFHKDIF